MKSRRIIFVILVLLCVILFGGVIRADDAANWGLLQIDIKLDGKQLNRSMGIIKDDLFHPGNTDGFGGDDTEEALFMSDRSGGFVDVEGHKVVSEFSANSSRTGKHIKGFYTGTITPGNEPNIVAELTWLYAEPTEGRFGDMSLILTKEDSDANNIDVGGYRGDLRAEMANSGTPDFASIPLGKAPAGTYDENGPYFVQLRLDFEKLIADLDNDNEVNLKDFSIVAKYWGYEGACLADITGIDGIPDMTVDEYDLEKFAVHWLQ